MNIIDFCELTSQDSLLNYKVILFRADLYPALFFSNIINNLRKKYYINIIDLEAVTFKEASMRLDISFLGSSTIYFLKNCPALDSSAINYLNSYNGPNTIILVQATETNFDFPSKNLVVDLPDHISSEVYAVLYTYFYNSPADQFFIKSVFQQQKKVTFDLAYMLMSYQALLGRRSESFFSDWFSKIAIADKSLFQLSQYFFGLQKTEFFKYFEQIKNDFPQEFWVSYWSEQIMQATTYICLLKEKGPLETQKQTFRLPFSFKNKDWKLHTISSLSKAHDYLYSIDHSIKNSLADGMLELWCHKFLFKHF